MAENNNNDEQIFNEDELQDIMNEFESLEREFHEGEGETESEMVDASADAQEVSEVEEPAEGELHVSEPEPNDNVVSIAAKPKAASQVSPAAPTAAASSNSVSMSLEFPIGEQVAQIGISPEYGFSFNMDGVELTIDAENGCVMTLPGGMTFTIPVNSPAQKTKKSA